MRIDVYLNLIGIFKTRSAAGRAISAGYVSSGGRKLKASSSVSVDDRIEVVKPDGRELLVEVIAIPESRQVSRRDRGLYHRILEDQSGW